MRILQLLDSLEAGGAQRVALGLSDWLVRQGHEVTLVARTGALRSEIPDGVNYVAAPAPFVGYAKIATRVVARLRPTIIHSHQRPEAILGVVLSKVFRCVAVEHAHTVLADRSKRVLSFRSTYVFAVSPAVKHMVIHDFGRAPGRVVLVRNRPALKHSQTSSPAGLAGAIRAAPAGQADAVHIVGVGRLTEQKDPLRFVDVLDVLSRMRRITATWVGDGPLLREMQNRADERDVELSLVGYQSDVTPFIDSASAVLMTSRWEGMPLVALETLSRGRVLIAPRVDGLVDLVGENQFGLGYDVGATATEIARTIEQFLGSDQWQRWRELGPVHIGENYSEAAAYGPIAAAYEELSARAGARIVAVAEAGGLLR